MAPPTKASPRPAIEPFSAAQIQRDLEEQRERDEEGDQPEPPSKNGPQNEEWTFRFEYVDPRGKVWVGPFTDKIIEDRQTTRMIEQMEAMLARGQAHESLSPNAREMNHKQAHMAFSLIDKPKWAADLDKLPDHVIRALWEKVEEHEAGYFRPVEAQAGSAKVGS